MNLYISIQLWNRKISVLLFETVREVIFKRYMVYGIKSNIRTNGKKFDEELTIQYSKMCGHKIFLFQMDAVFRRRVSPSIDGVRVDFLQQIEEPTIIKPLQNV